MSRPCEIQSRDTELERTVQELGAALVVARNKEQKNRINKGDRTNGDESEPDHLNSFRARVEALESDLESANAHLALERERVSKQDSFILEVLFLLDCLNLIVVSKIVLVIEPNDAKRASRDVQGDDAGSILGVRQTTSLRSTNCRLERYDFQAAIESKGSREKSIERIYGQF